MVPIAVLVLLVGILVLKTFCISAEEALTCFWRMPICAWGNWKIVCGCAQNGQHSVAGLIWCRMGIMGIMNLKMRNMINMVERQPIPMVIYNLFIYYEEPHDGATHWIYTELGVLLREEDYTYDGEGRILHCHSVETRENEGVTIIDREYSFTGNHSFVMTYTEVWPDGVYDPEQLEEQFYDAYGSEIYQ